MITKQLQYIDDHGNKRTVELENTTNRMIGSWSNPDFIILEQQNQQVEYFTYLGGDGGIWQTKVHCNDAHPPLGGGLPDVEFESRHIGGHSNSGKAFQVKNHNMQTVTINGLSFGSVRLNDTGEYTISFDITVS